MKRIKIELSPEEDAIVYYEKTMGRNKTIRQRAAILYEAGRRAESMMGNQPENWLSSAERKAGGGKS